ncbi:MAG TPA: DUF5666 domain-containing protein [Thermoanaerobaculia bacterium]|nr:DUF5666 domain-containing protein [Thermoanaerobaculia bacterium]
MKKLTLTLLALVAVVLAAGCERENDITGAFGKGVVTGQVVLVGDLAGGSPAGIVVSVPGTGMEVVLAEDGRFLFSGVPKGATLQFERGSDGISAAYQLGGVASADVMIDLERGEASRGRRRPSIARALQLQGKIVAVSDESITVDAAGKGETTAAFDENTVIRKGNEWLEPADLAVDDKVHVMAQPDDGDGLVARLVILQDFEEDGEEGDEPEVGAKVELEGLITEVSDDSITVDAAGKGPTTATIDGETVIRRGGTMLSASDLEEGDRVHVRARKEGEGLVAELIILQSPF